TGLDIPGKPHTDIWNGIFETCNETYFQTIGYRLLAGSVFSASDVATGRQVAVINDTLRKRYFGDEDPLGRQLVLKGLASGPGGSAAATFQIAGVVRDVRNRGLEEPISPQVFIPYTATPLGSSGILIRTSIDPRHVAASLRPEMRAVNGNVIQRDPYII